MIKTKRTEEYGPSSINFWEQSAHCDFLLIFSQLVSDRLGNLISLSARL